MVEILEEKDQDTGTNTSNWVVLVHNNETNTIEQVINILMVATKCSYAEAEMETWEIHHLGKSIVHHSSHEECEEIAKIISSIGIVTEVYQE